MKKLMTALALATLAASAGAQVTFSGGLVHQPLLNYDPNGAAGGLAPNGGQENAPSIPRRAH